MCAPLSFYSPPRGSSGEVALRKHTDRARPRAAPHLGVRKPYRRSRWVYTICTYVRWSLTGLKVESLKTSTGQMSRGRVGKHLVWREYPARWGRSSSNLSDCGKLRLGWPPREFQQGTHSGVEKQRTMESWSFCCVLSTPLPAPTWPSNSLASYYPYDVIDDEPRLIGHRRSSSSC